MLETTDQTIDPPMPAGTFRQHGLAGLRLETLNTVRWVAVGGQSFAVAVTHFWLGFQLPLLACVAAILSAALLNVVLGLRDDPSPRLNDRQATIMLGFDTLQLAVLLYLTGGLGNPFALLFLVPVTIAAASLRLPAVLVVGALSITALTVVAGFHLPIPWYASGELTLPRLYIVGLWIALVSTMVFLTFYAWRIANETRRMQEALAATELVLARETQLSALDGLAAAAAHDLGTPLSTIAVVASELNREHGDDPNLAEDLGLLMSQAKRCRATLATLAAKGSDTLFARMRLSVAVTEVADPYHSNDIELTVETKPREGSETSEPIIHRNPGVLYSLGNLIDNATDFASGSVNITTVWDDDEIVIDIKDDGPGVASDALSRLGEPFVSRRSDRRKSRQHGQGLGFFIARTLIERSGGVLTIANRTPPHRGAWVQVRWPRSALDMDREDRARENLTTEE